MDKLTKQRDFPIKLFSKPDPTLESVLLEEKVNNDSCQRDIMETIAINETEMFSNPIAPMEEEIPPLQESDEQPSTVQRLTNADFRKLLMTPRVSGSTSQLKSVSATGGSTSTTTGGNINTENTSSLQDDDARRNEAAERRKKRKLYYAKLKKHDKDGQEDLSSKYRDRAKERREGKTDYQEPELLATTADYRAVAPTAAAGQSYAERRRQVIQESKYLGGDMQHTHLVKGLDYALLEKVRTEITSKETEENELDEALLSEEKPEIIEKDEEEKLNFKAVVSKNIYRVLFKNRLPDRNELFQPGRMAYRFELEEEFAELDVPTTVIRSKAELPQADGRASLTTNEIVIQKLTQIFSYLRAGRRQQKRAKMKGKTATNTGGPKDEHELDIGPKVASHGREKPQDASTNIYEGLDNYVAAGVSKKDRRGGTGEKRDRERERDREHEKDRERRERANRERRPGEHRDYRDVRRDNNQERRGDNREHRSNATRDRARPNNEPKRPYFDKIETEEEILHGTRLESARDLVKDVNQRFGHYAEEETHGESDKGREKARLERIRAKTKVSGYDECYPGLVESYDAMGDSDDEADYTKMDMGNKKGPVGRWDFESQEDYSRYMSSKEALPKAAFQYGVKMQDGRRTRRAGPKDEKAELNRQLQRIQSLMNKRKEMAGGGGAGGGPDNKVRRF